MKTFTPLFFLLLFLQSSFPQVIVVNEAFNGSSQKTDWVELLVVQNNLDLRNYQVRDFTAMGIPQTPLRFTNNPYWNGIHAGTLIVITGDSSIFVEDTSKGDFIIQLRFKGASDTTYFRGSQFDIAITSDAIQARRPLPDTSHLHGIAWGSNNINSLPAPRAYRSGQLAIGSSLYFSKPTIMTFSDFGVDANLSKDTLGGTRGHPNDSTTGGGNYLYILGLRGTIGIQPTGSIAHDYHLYQNYPNPFNPSTTIEFDVPKSAYTTLEVYDLLGKNISTLVNEKIQAGKYSIAWLAAGYPSGVYFYKLETDEYSNTKKMILAK